MFIAFLWVDKITIKLPILADSFEDAKEYVKEEYNKLLNKFKNITDNSNAGWRIMDSIERTIYNYNDWYDIRRG